MGRESAVDMALFKVFALLSTLAALYTDPVHQVNIESYLRQYWQSAARRAPVRLLPLSLVYLALGDRERALDSLRQALAQHQSGGRGLRSPVYDLPADSRCEDLLRRAGAGALKTPL
jgi:hypothetical protein